MPEQQSPADYKGYKIRVYQEATFGGTAAPGWCFNIYEPGNPLSTHRGIEYSVPATIAAVCKWIDEHALTEG